MENKINTLCYIPLAPKLCLGVYIRTQESIQSKKKSKLYSLLLIHPHFQAINYILHSYTLPNTVWEQGKNIDLQGNYNSFKIEVF